MEAVFHLSRQAGNRDEDRKPHEEMGCKAVPRMPKIQTGVFKLQDSETVTIFDVYSTLQSPSHVVYAISLTCFVSPPLPADAMSLSLQSIILQDSNNFPAFLCPRHFFLASFLHLGDAPVLLISVQLSSLPSAVTQTWHLEATFKHHIQHHDLVGSLWSQEAPAGTWAGGRPIPVPSY